MSDGKLRMPLPLDGPALLGHVVALAIVAAALMVRLLILPVENGAAHLTFYPAVVASFYLLGFWPGLTSVAVSAVTAYFIFMPPFWSWRPSAGSLATSLTFAVVSVLLGYLIERIRQVQNAEALANTRLASIIQDQTELVCRMTADRVVLYANPAYCRAFGLDARAIVGRCLPHRAIDEDRPAVAEARARLTPDQPCTTLELRTTMAGGRIGWVQANLQGYFDESGELRELQYVGRETTERKALEARLMAANTLLREAYDKAPAGYHSVDAAGRYRDMNDLFESWLGSPREQVIGKLGPPDFTDEDGRTLFRASFPALIAAGQCGPLEYNLISRDGHVRRVSISSVAVYGGDGRFEHTRTVSYDITDLHDTRTELQRALAEQRAISDNQLIAFLKVRNGMISWVNAGFCALFGYRAEDLIGLPVRRLYPDEAAFASVTEGVLSKFGAGESFRAQVRMCHQDGRLIWIDLAGSELAGGQGESLWTLVDITRMRMHQEAVEHVALHDTLTGLANRALLDDRMRQALALADRVACAVAVCYVDLDGFKAVNDRHGHDAGDTLLREVARRLESVVRTHDTVARVGGDEFVLLLTRLAHGVDCRMVLERAVDLLRQPIVVSADTDVEISATIGVALYPLHGTDPQFLLAQADRAMLAAKRAGKNRVRFHGEMATGYA